MDINSGFVPILGFEKYVINRDGCCFNVVNKIPISWHESNGYQFAVLYDNRNKRCCIGRHRALALAFLPVSDNPKKLTVNHKDGVRSNNSLNNLEWASRTANIIHAYQTNLRTDKIPVTVINELTKETKRYFSIGECCRCLKLDNFDFTRAARGKVELRGYLSDYVFILHRDESSWSNKPRFSSSIVAKNIFTEQLVVAKTAGELGKVLGINPKIITKAILSESVYPIKEYVFRLLKVEVSWPKYTESELGALYGHKFIHQMVEIEDSNGSLYLHGSVRSASKQTGTGERSIRFSLKNNLPCVNGFKYKKYVIVPSNGDVGKVFP